MFKNLVLAFGLLFALGAHADAQYATVYRTQVVQPFIPTVTVHAPLTTVQTVETAVVQAPAVVATTYAAPLLAAPVCGVGSVYGSSLLGASNYGVGFGNRFGVGHHFGAVGPRFIGGGGVVNVNINNRRGLFGFRH